MKLPIRLHLLHQNCLFRNSLADCFSVSGQYDATAIDHHSESDLDNSLRSEAELYLLDLRLPDGMTIEILKTLRDRGSHSKSIVLIGDDRSGLVQCIQAGANGCVLESSSLHDLYQAIERVSAGEMHCPPQLLESVYLDLARPPVTHHAQQVTFRRLTSREMQILDLLAKRKSNKEIASQLCVSIYTVKNHVHNILEKLNVESRFDAVEVARNQSL